MILLSNYPILNMLDSKRLFFIKHDNTLTDINFSVSVAKITWIVNNLIDITQMVKCPSRAKLQSISAIFKKKY